MYRRDMIKNGYGFIRPRRMDKTIFYFLFFGSPRSIAVTKQKKTHPDRNKIYNAVIHRMVVNSLEEKERAFLKNHGEDSNEVILDYLRHCATELRHSPWPKEIIGWRLISERFGTWEKALEAAKLSKPVTANKPSSFRLVQRERALQKEIYRQRKLERQQKSLNTPS